MAGFNLTTLAGRHDLDDAQVEFVRGIVIRGENLGDAARKAGYGEDNAHKLLAIPRVAAALHEAVQIALQADAPVNLRVLRKIRDDDSAAAGVRADIAVKLLKLAGHVEPAKSGDSAPQKQLSEMSRDELRDHMAANLAEINKLEDELASRAIDVSAPASAPNESDAGSNPKQYLE